eukprot:1142387-Pelagomonas_calceolata.AAC.2
MAWMWAGSDAFTDRRDNRRTAQWRVGESKTRATRRTCVVQCALHGCTGRTHEGHGQKQGTTAFYGGEGLQALASGYEGKG